MSYTIPFILAAAILIAGAFAFLPVQEAVTLHLPTVNSDTITDGSITAADIQADTLSLPLMAHSTDTINTGAATEFMGIIGEEDELTGTGGDHDYVIPQTGTITDLTVQLSGDIGTAGDDLIVGLIVNGLATSLTCTISGGAGTEDTCSDTTNTADVTSGDTVRWQLVTSSTPAAVAIDVSAVMTIP